MLHFFNKVETHINSYIRRVYEAGLVKAAAKVKEIQKVAAIKLLNVLNHKVTDLLALVIQQGEYQKASDNSKSK